MLRGRNFRKFQTKRVQYAENAHSSEESPEMDRMHVNGILSDEILFNHKTKKPMAPLRVSKNLQSSVLPNFKTDVRNTNISVGGGVKKMDIAALSN